MSDGEIPTMEQVNELLDEIVTAAINVGIFRKGDPLYGNALRDLAVARVALENLIEGTIGAENES